MGSSSNNNTTLQDLAQLAGVSISTVSRALNDHPLISARTKQKIWALARDHDYPFRPYMPAAPVGAEGTIVIVTPFMRGRPLPLSHPFFLELLASIGEAARARDCDFTVSHTTPANYEDLVATTTTSRASGVIFLGQSMLHDAFNQLTESNANFVVWGAQMAGQLYCSIGSDNQLGGRRATAHLARLGRKAILFLGGTDPESMQRKRGYNEALKEAGLEMDPKLVVPVDFELESADAAISRLLRRHLHFDGIVASSDLIALGAIRALRRAGVSVPSDVSVVGYDDMLLARLSTPALSTIRQDTFEAGRQLVSRILDPSPDPSAERLPTDLIVRESCGGMRRYALLAAILLTACSPQPKREAWAVVVSIAPDANPKWNPNEVMITARTPEGAFGSKRVLIARLNCRVGDTVHGSARGLALTLDERACERR